MSRQFESIAQLVRSRADTPWDLDQRLALRARVVEAATCARASRRRSPAWWLAAAAAPLTLVGALLIGDPTPAGRLTVEVDGRAAERGLEAGVEARRSLQFSDGSRVQLLRPGATRVAEATADGATVELLEGRAEVQVMPRRKASWRFAAGPYVVHVVGTRFELEWDNARGRLEIAMHEGAVRVTGPELGEGKWLRDQQRLEAALPERGRQPPSSLPLAAPSTPSLDESFAAPAPKESFRPPVPESAESHGEKKPGPGNVQPRGPRTRGVGASSPLLAELAHRGDYAQVIAEAKRRGLSTLLESGAVAELRALADSSRYTGERDLAQRALLALRSRFPRASEAEGAAFMLGRLAEESDGPVALEWYERYLDEAPRGPLAAEASGRRLLLLHRLERRAAALGAAREYLRQFPDGAHAHHARDIASSQRDSLE